MLLFQTTWYPLRHLLVGTDQIIQDEPDKGLGAEVLTLKTGAQKIDKELKKKFSKKIFRKKISLKVLN